MAMKITKAQLDKMQSRYNAMANRVKKVRKEAESVAETVVQTMEIGITAFGMGMVNGRFVNDEGERGIQVLGVPIDLGGAVVLHGLGFFMPSGGKRSWAKDLHNLGDGMLASYLTVTGIGLGDKMRRESARAQNTESALPEDTTSGRHFPRNHVAGRGLSAAELRNLARF